MLGAVGEHEREQEKGNEQLFPHPSSCSLWERQRRAGAVTETTLITEDTAVAPDQRDAHSEEMMQALFCIIQQTLFTYLFFKILTKHPHVTS